LATLQAPLFKGGWGGLRPLERPPSSCGNSAARRWRSKRTEEGTDLFACARRCTLLRPTYRLAGLVMALLLLCACGSESVTDLDPVTGLDPDCRVEACAATLAVFARPHRTKGFTGTP
jgi:hypothetical protein